MIHRDFLALFTFIAIVVTMVAARLAHWHPEPVVGVIAFGACIVAAAFIMGTAAEIVQLDVPQSIAIVLIALLAVLPEYAVDIYLSWAAGEDAKYASLALANMTGANRLLIGLGWPFIAFLWWRRAKNRVIELEPSNGGEIFFLALATLWSAAIPLKGTLSIVDTGVLLVLFVLYLRFARAQPKEEPHLVGPAERIGALPVGKRRFVNLALFVVAGAGIFAASEPFAENLIACGHVLGVSEFLLVQWLAPLASESPEFLVAALLVLKLQPTAGFGALLSSKLNQWTLLVGAVPVAFGISHMVHKGSFVPLVIDERQIGELVLTVAQSFLGVCILLNRRFELHEAVWLFVLFATQLVASIAMEEMPLGEDHDLWVWREKIFFSVLYAIVGSWYLLRYRKYLGGLASIAFLRGDRANGTGSSHG
ncbi:MAG: sodium:calcium antiporter [Planctomycetes bacterium]|nr:sodium:calcium antiporter [Planctomycetota bacterium]